MAKGIEIGIGVDTKAAKQGLEAGLIEPLEDAQGALEDLGRDKGPDKLERNLEAAQDATERLKKETRETADAIEREYRDAYRKLKTESKEGYRKASDAAEGFKDEAKQNFAETASSFDGSMESIADGVQGTLGGLATSISGPLGIAAAGAGAVAGAFLNSWITSTEETKQAISDMYEDMLESGQEYLSQDFLNRKTQELVENEGKMAELRAIQYRTGVDLNTLILAELTAGKERTQVQAILNKQLEDASVSEGDYRKGVEGANAQLREQVQHYNDLNGQQESAASKAAIVRDVWADIAKRGLEAAASAKTQGERLQAQADTLRGMPKSLTVNVDADTSALDRALRTPRRVPVDLVTRSGKRVPW